MATHAGGFERFESKISPPPFQPETEAKPIEIVPAPTREDIGEILAAGADIVVCQDFETRMVYDATFDKEVAQHGKPIRTTYVAGSEARINDLLKDGFFSGARWEKDTSTYAPYVCLKIQDAESPKSVYAALNSIFGEKAALNANENYVWNKQQDERERREKDEMADVN